MLTHSDRWHTDGLARGREDVYLSQKSHQNISDCKKQERVNHNTKRSSLLPPNARVLDDAAVYSPAYGRQQLQSNPTTEMNATQSKNRHTAALASQRQIWRPGSCFP